MKLYSILTPNGMKESFKPGKYIGSLRGKTFGKHSCSPGGEKNKIHFNNLTDAVDCGYRPCKKCKPINEDDFETIKNRIDEKTLEEFYDRK